MIEFGECQAPTHHPDCNGIATTADHFTPKCIAKLLGWSRSRLNDPGNIQFLSKPCHILKDRTTPSKCEQVKFQISGGMLKFGEHR